MAQKKHKPEEIVVKLRQDDVLLSQGQPAAEAIRAIDELRPQGILINSAMQAGLSPLGWDRINLSGDYVWSDSLGLDENGLMPLLAKPYRESMSQ